MGLSLPRLDSRDRIALKTMQLRHQATRAAIELIKRFEGFRRRAARLPDGTWTIGYGHTRTARDGAEISEADADALLIYDVAAVVKAINEWVFSPLTQNQFDALTAFAFNIGLPNFRRSSVLRRLNEGSHLQAACAMEMWRTADFEGERIVIDALVRRRSAEMALFLTPMEGFIPVPSLIVMPRVDDDVARGAPLHAAAEVEAPLSGHLAEVYRTDEPMPSAGRAAAEAVSQRLNAILQDYGAEPEAPAAKPLPMVDEDALQAPPEQTGEALAVPPLEVHDLPEPETAAATAEEASPLAFNMLTASLARSKKKARPPEPVLALMGIVGLAVFATGIMAFNARASERLPLLADPVAAGWGLGLIGVALAASSVYFLLNRLGGKGE
jgi:lysozyme